MKLNLGAGKNPLPGYCNIDIGYDYTEETAFGAEGPQTVRDEVYPLPALLTDKGITEIRASHVLEHLSWRVTMDVIRDWVRVLQPGGILKIAVPDFEWICRQYLAEVDGAAPREDRITAYLMGAQLDENDYHKAIFDVRGLKHGMELAGLVDVGPWQSDADDCSALPVSLNMQGTKPGVLAAVTDIPQKSAEAAETATDGQETTPFAWLLPRAYNKYTQWGEDGLLEAIFEKIGTTNRTVIECGAGHPVRGSNSRKLIEEGWTALLVEPDPEKRNALFAEYGDRSPLVKIVPYTVAARTDWESGRLSMDDVLLQNRIPTAPDLLVIDVDGQDWYLWNGLLNYRPRVVIIEFGHLSDPDFIPAENGPGQAGEHAIEQLAKYKGYEPILLTGHNFICVDRNLIPLLTDGKELTEADTIQFRPKEIACVMSVPRLGFISNMQCLLTIANLGIAVRQQQGAFWGQCLTDGLLYFCEDDPRKYILTVDYDSIFTAEDVLRLYSIMETPGQEYIDALTSVQVRREHNNILLSMADDEGKPRGEVTRDEMMKETVRVRTAHFGLTLFRVDALKRTPHPWFLDVPDDEGKWGPGKSDCDVQFWHRFTSAGNALYLANRVTVGHLEQVISWPNNTLGSQFQRISEYQKGGKPAGCWK